MTTMGGIAKGLPLTMVQALDRAATVCGETIVKALGLGDATRSFVMCS